MKRGLRCLLGAVSLALLLYGGYRACGTLEEDARSDAVQREAAAQAVAAVAVPPAVSPGAQGTAFGAQPVAEQAPITVDFGALRAVNPDVAGWLYCADTPINYPVVQGGDNVFYLRHLLSGERNRSGTLFVDWRNREDFTDDQSVIYGHHMRKGTMFACLVEYRKQEYYAAHPAMYLLTPERGYRLELFSGYVVNPAEEEFPLWFDTAENRAAYVEQAVERSDFVSDTVVTEADLIVTLSTCTYEFENARYVVHAALRAIG